ncbi:hypothetical protein GCM10022286_25400 [Gryllotalpicola daejeonensis]|uniref:Uncharacterized protein n=1 Tax=Gryllotalpicola daejeonensis TaxID=993087 RepID=A0ABP7ZM67_9MICO
MSVSGARGIVTAVAVALAAAVLGGLPWLLTGARLPLQNLWASETPPAQMPHTMLPFSQYSLVFQASIIIVGAGLAGLSVRLLARVLDRHAPLAGVAGAMLAVLYIAAIIQTGLTVASGLQRDLPGWRGVLGDEDARPLSGASQLYLAGLIGVAIVVVLFALAVYVVVARARVPAAAVALSIVAVLLGPWVRELVQATAVIEPTRPAAWLDPITWVPPIGVGLAICWCGVRGVRRIVAAAVCLAVLWLVPALLETVSAVAGSRALVHDPRELADYGWGLFRMLLGPAGWSLPLLGAAVVVAVAGAVGARLVRRARPPASP